MKKCPFCAEEILDEAIKCKHCGEFMRRNAPPWYARSSSFVVAFLFVGPLALPLLWFNPRRSLRYKLIGTFIVVAVTALLSVLMARSLKAIISYYGAVFGPCPLQ